ncbi:MAG: MBL fold metallo-hydrolase [Planctomycetia bacterium]|nr:MBL fold metallo-hydrolase [Planctomycetia bacterium]
MANMLTGKELISDIDGCDLPEGQVGLWWTGQHGFIIKMGKTVLYLDVFFSPHPERLVPPLLKADETCNADVFLGSHDHGDHIDRDAWPDLAKASPSAVFVVPELVREGVARDLAIPSERFVGLDDGTRIEIKGVTVTGVASAHEFLDRDEGTGRYPYLGFVISGHGFCLYHSGDTCIYEGLQTKLRHWSLDAMIVPINGRDARRLAAGCIGNMTYQEAADLAGALEPGMTIPGHYDMFASNSEDPQLFLDYMSVKYPDLKAMVWPYGERVVLSK